jgi:HPt (histidine-containing phosphotransfer) domain-containing protein
MSKDFYSSPRYLAIVERFKKELPDMVNELSEAVRMENWERVKDKSHELKGIGGALGFPQITEIALKMYKQAVEGNHDQVTLTCAELEKECQSLVRSFKQVDS